MYMIEISEDKHSKIKECLHKAKELLCDVEEVMEELEDNSHEDYRQREQYRMGGRQIYDEPYHDEYREKYREKYRRGGRY